MSPSYFNGGTAVATGFNHSTSGYAGYAVSVNGVNGIFGLRPVINLQFDNYQKMEILIDKEFIDKVK